MRNEYFVFQFFVDINKKKTAEEYKVKFDKLIALSRQESPERERKATIANRIMNGEEEK
jgi:hypothetical protein